MRSIVSLLATVALGSVAVSAGTRVKPIAAAGSSSCSYNGYDFSSLMGSTYQLLDQASDSTYYLSVCGSLDYISACSNENAEASTCQVVQSITGANVYGEWNPEANPPTWSMMDNGQVGVQYKLEGEDACYIRNMPPEEIPFTSYVQFVCAETAGPLVVSSSDSSACSLNYTLTTPLACPSKPPQPSPPQPKSDCAFEGFDFSSLSDRDLVGSDGDNGNRFAYYLRVCGVLNSPAAEGCSSQSFSTSACQIQQVGVWIAYDTGDWNPSAPHHFEYIEPATPSAGVQYTIIGQPDCSVNSEMQYFSTTVQLVCSANSDEPFKVITPSAHAPCNFTYIVPTPLACSSKEMNQPEGLILF